MLAGLGKIRNIQFMVLKGTKIDFFIKMSLRLDYSGHDLGFRFTIFSFLSDSWSFKVIFETYALPTAPPIYC